MDKTVVHLVRRFGSQFTALHVWKCPRVADLSPLEDMPNLTHVAFCWNQRPTPPSHRRRLSGAGFRAGLARAGKDHRAQ